jgi:glycosyltransferase involved in cell wall biosynthesis
MPPKPLRVGIDARAASEVPAGRGVYVRELVRGLVELDAGVEPILYGREPWQLDGTRWVSLPTPDPIWAVRAARLASRQCDALLAANSFLMAAVAGPRSVAVVHDLFGFSRRFGAPAGGLGERATLPLAARRAAGFICVSAATRDDLVGRHPALAERTVVIPHGVSARFSRAPAAGTPARYGLDGDYVLAVGTREPRKNLPRLVEAFVGLPPEVRKGRRLAVAGPPGWSDSEIEALATTHDDVVLLGYVDDQDLAGLYAGAAVFAFPSLAEGFGMPVLEAMAAGTPVLTSDRSSLSEVAGDAALLVDPTDTVSIREALRRILSDSALRSDLAAKGRERAAGFTWRRCARETLDYLTSVTSTLDAGKSRARKVSS